MEGVFTVFILLLVYTVLSLILSSSIIIGLLLELDVATEGVAIGGEEIEVDDEEGVLEMTGVEDVGAEIVVLEVEEVDAEEAGKVEAEVEGKVEVEVEMEAVEGDGWMVEFGGTDLLVNVSIAKGACTCF